MKVAIICNHASHVETVLGLNPSSANLLIITPEATDKMYGYKDIYYYAIRPMYAREKAYAESHDWKSVNKTELKELVNGR